MAGRTENVTRGDDVAANPERTDRWNAPEFSPPTDSAVLADPVVLDYEDDGRVAVITLNSPPDNAITTEMERT